MTRLNQYNKKRDFTQSPEPEGEVESQNQFRFCVQQHDARRMHYDFRIELDGVLLSWAVPKGPSSDPSVKRLAIQTEDHPISYLTFEGTIPKGNYGAGTVILWDVGTYKLPADKKELDVTSTLRNQYEEGKIHLYFEGYKIQGEYSLIRTGNEKQWLLIKGKDEYANGKAFSPESVLSKRAISDVEEAGHPLADIMKEGKASDFPEEFRPMLASLSKQPFSHHAWIYEVKYDGYRCLIFKNEQEIRMLSRNGMLLNDRFPDLLKAAEELPSSCVVDGEIIVPDRSGGGDFSNLQAMFREGKSYPSRCVLFDLIFLEGRDLSSVPLFKRKEALELIMAGVTNRRIVFSSHIEKHGKAYWQASRKLGLEGIIAKKMDSLYYKNTRSELWLKFKSMKEEEFVIAGLTPSSSRTFGSLLLARPAGNGEFEFAGKVGTGFTDGDMKQIFKSLKAKKRKKGIVDPREEVLFFTEPHYMATVRFKEKTVHGKLRHPTFIGLRDDKFYDHQQNLSDQAEPSDPEGSENFHIPESVTLTNTDKVFFPKEGVTKGDVIRYYAQMVDYILPHLQQRPLTLKRTPNGIKDDGFYQKDVGDDLPEFVDTRKIASKSSDKDYLNYALCNNEETLIFLANYGCVEMHCWNSRVDKLDHPDHMVFDLDPPGTDFDLAREGAYHLIEILEGLEIHFGIKTSGGDGIHVYVPIERKYTHRQVRDMTHVIAKVWLKKIGEKGSLERSPSKRKKHVYLDYLQNSRGKTMAAPFSLRVRTGVPVSMPLTIQMLKKLKSPSEMNLKTVPELIRSIPNPWESLYDHRMRLETIVRKLEGE